SCIGESRETRSAIAPPGRSVRVAGPQKAHVILPANMRFRGSVEATAVGLGALRLACAFTSPYILNFNDAGRLDTNDGRWSIWVVSWVAHALTTDPLQLFRANTFHSHATPPALSH